MHFFTSISRGRFFAISYNGTLRYVLTHQQTAAPKCRSVAGLYLSCSASVSSTLLLSLHQHNVVRSAFCVTFVKMAATGALIWTIACPILATLTGLQGSASLIPSSQLQPRTTRRLVTSYHECFIMCDVLFQKLTL
jgi:hypothetical protein